jgi:hypothetical protein
LVISDGSWITSSATNKAAPTSLKQLEANKKPIPAASTESFNFGWALTIVPHDSNLDWRCLARETNAALAIISSLF